MRLQAFTPAVAAVFMLAAPTVTQRPNALFQNTMFRQMPCPGDMKGTVDIAERPGESVYVGICTAPDGTVGKAAVRYRHAKASPPPTPL